MKQYNPGNLLKFNLQSIFQRHKQPGQDRHPFGLKCPKARLLPMQIFVESGATVATWKLVSPADTTGATIITMDPSDLTITQKSGGGTWITWGGFSDITNAATCGYWEVWITADGTDYFSEVIHLREDTEPEPVWRMRFGHDTDKGNVLYQGGYQQLFYPTKFAWDRLEIDRDEEVSVDGYGNSTTKFSRTVARFRLEVADIPDYAVAFFAKCGDLDNAVLEDTVEGYFVTMDNITFEAKQQGVGLNIGVFKFDAEVESFNGCQQNYELA